jgi:glycosyltransferase involved in cell wall biosynthesis
MRILITCDLFAPQLKGGTELIAYKLAKFLNSKNFEVFVVCKGRKNLKIDKIKTFRSEFRRWYLANLLLLPKILVMIKKLKIDLILNFTFDTSFASWLAAKVCKKPILMYIMGVYGDAWIEMRNSFLKGKLRKFFEFLQLKLPAKKLFLSEYSRNLAIQLYKIRKKETEILTPPIDYKKFKPSKKKRFVLFVGRMVKQKGVEYLIEAARLLPSIKFLLVGEGEERKRLEKVAPSNVKFLGFLRPESKKLLKLYSEALIFCLPSIGEGLGIVLLEAMASGCVIISTIPFDYEGFLVPKKDPKALAEKIEFLIKNEKLALKMGRENRRRAKQYGWGKILQIFKKYESRNL